MEENGQIVPAGAPNGVFAVSVDDKGRLKLPASLLTYLEGFKEDRKVFITTFDESEARIYPISVWRETEKKLQEPGDDFEALEALAKVADSLRQRCRCRRARPADFAGHVAQDVGFGKGRSADALFSEPHQHSEQRGI